MLFDPISICKFDKLKKIIFRYKENFIWEYLNKIDTFDCTLINNE